MDEPGDSSDVMDSMPPAEFSRVVQGPEQIFDGIPARVALRILKLRQDLNSLVSSWISSQANEKTEVEAFATTGGHGSDPSRRRSLPA